MRTSTACLCAWLAWYERPWTGETHFMCSDQGLLEAACHEGNYTMRFNLEAARTLEAHR